MTNSDKPVEPIEGTVRLAKFNDEHVSGRLEYFAENHWGSVCNKGFGTKEA
jgi:hypothetical protein